MISNFISQIRTRGLAKNNRYEVQIPFPLAVSQGLRRVGEVASLFCESATLPGITIDTQPHRFFGEIRQMPIEKTFEPVSLSFYVDAEMTIRSAFDRWQALIIDPFTRTIGYYDDYKTDVVIKIYTINDTNPYTIKLFEAYPKSVSSIQLESESKQLMKMTVLMQYKYWYSTINDIDTSTVEPSAQQDPAGILTTTGVPLSRITTSSEPVIT